MTAENPLPNPFLEQAESELGVATGSRMSQKDIYILEDELRDAAALVYKEGRKSTTSQKYRQVKAKYDAALRKYNAARRKKGLKNIVSIEEIDDETSTTTTNINTLQNQLNVANSLGEKKRAKELETQIAEANALRSANIASSTGTKGVSQSGYAGRIPDTKQTQPIYNADGTISVVDANNEPVAVGNIKLDGVYIVFQNKNFYERGIKSTVKSIEYKTEEELRQMAFSLDKDSRKKLQEEFKKSNLLPKDYVANGEFDRDAAFETAFLTAHSYANRINYNRLVNNQPLVGIVEAVNEYRKTEGEGAGPQVSRGISQFSLSDGDAANILEEFYTQALGVRPKADDIEKFKEIVKKRAAKRPRITQTTTTTDGDVTTTSGKVIEEGFGLPEAQRLARRQAEARPEFAPYQMATTFYDAVLRAAQSPVRIPGPTG